MIYLDSRYADGNVVPVETNKGNSIAVFREFPTARTEFFLYEWKDRDRIDVLAYNLLGSSDLWWKIMDFNPELSDPFVIPIGTVIRIPRV